MKGFLLPSVLLMIFGGLFGVTKATDAQDLDLAEVIVSVELDDAPLKMALDEIERQTELTFAFSYNAIDSKRIVSVPEQEQSVEEVLQYLFKEQWVSWVLSGKTVLLKKWSRLQERQSRQIQDQIEGQVTDAETGETLPGVNILVKGTTTGASTDQNGNFELTVPSLQDTLVVTYIGYQRQEVPVNGRTEIDIQLAPQAILGEEMVVVGYGEQKEINLTGAVSQITEEELNDRSVSNLSKALQGRIPNLNVIFGSGKPGSSGNLNIRGNTSITSSGEPLVLIDGVPGDMDQINPRNVESISVLKDASAAAVYGARAAFGVILIETKDATSGETSITYRNNFSWKTFSTNTNFETTAHDWLRLNEETYYNALGRKWSGYTEEDYREIYERRNDVTEHPDRPWIEVKPDRSGNDVYKYYGNFDWHNYFYSMWRPKQDHDLSIQGGTDKIQYSLSGSISDETGIMKQNPDTYNRKNFRSKIDYEIFPWLTVSNNTKYFNSKYTYYGKSGGMFDEVHNNLTTNQIYMLSPSYLPKNPDGTNTYLKDDGTYAFGYGAHIAVANDKLQGNDITKDLRTTFEGEINLSDNLNIRANYTYNNERTHYDYRTVRLNYSLYPGEI